MHTRTLIVGGGQAGLAMGYQLRRAGTDFAILDAHRRIGDAWRQRWDSLTLFTPRRYDALPGRAFPGDPDGHPGKDEVAHYLAGYAPVFDDRGAPVHRGGVTAWPGLYFLGLPWQRTRGSAVLGWVGRDAEAIAGLVPSAAAPARAVAAVG